MHEKTSFRPTIKAKTSLSLYEELYFEFRARALCGFRARAPFQGKTRQGKARRGKDKDKYKYKY